MDFIVCLKGQARFFYIFILLWILFASTYSLFGCVRFSLQVQGATHGFVLLFKAESLCSLVVFISVRLMWRINVLAISKCLKTHIFIHANFKTVSASLIKVFYAFLNFSCLFSEWRGIICTCIRGWKEAAQKTLWQFSYFCTNIDWPEMKHYFRLITLLPGKRTGKDIIIIVIYWYSSKKYKTSDLSSNYPP
jgi:hypothetical protein